MAPVYKPFSRKLFKENDAICRAKIKAILKSTRYEIKDNINTKGVDLLVFVGGIHICNIECEKKTAFKGTLLSFDDVNLPYRKTKYAKLEKPTIFVILNEDLTSYIVITQDKVLLSPIAEVHNKFISSGEMFYKINKSNFTYNNLDEVLDDLYDQYVKENKNG